MSERRGSPSPSRDAMDDSFASARGALEDEGDGDAGARDGDDARRRGDDDARREVDDDDDFRRR